MRIMIFTEGTIIMQHGTVGLSRDMIVRQVQENEGTVNDFISYVPIGASVEKLNGWAKEGAEIQYLTSRTKPDEIESIRKVLIKYGFPAGLLTFRKANEEYKDIAERIVPDVLIEDDCESIVDLMIEKGLGVERVPIYAFYDRPRDFVTTDQD